VSAVAGSSRGRRCPPRSLPLPAGPERNSQWLPRLTRREARAGHRPANAPGLRRSRNRRVILIGPAQGQELPPCRGLLNWRVAAVRGAKQAKGAGCCNSTAGSAGVVRSEVCCWNSYNRAGRRRCRIDGPRSRIHGCCARGSQLRPSFTGGRDVKLCQTTCMCCPGAWTNR